MQVSIIYYINIGQVFPNIVLAFIIYISLFYSQRGYIYGFIMGTFIDLYNQHFGVTPLIYTIIVYIVSKISYKFYKGIIVYSILLILCSLFYQIIIASIQRDMSVYFLVRYIIPGSIYTTIIGIVIYYILNKCVK